MPRQAGAGSFAWNDPAGIESATPEQKLLVALIRQAVVDARAGDMDAQLWLIEDAPAWLPCLLPEDCDPDDIHEALLRAAGCPVRVASA